MDNNHDAEAPAAPAPANALPKGTRLHEYEIKAVIGEGGFGIVYLATDTLLGREVAIKEYLPVSHAARRASQQVEARTPDQQALFDKGLKSFVAEARILAQFRNPNLVEVMRFWEGNGTAYMVMPYYKGRTVRDLLQKGFRATEKVSLFNILLPLLQGLEQVHKVGCFHRDISPDNIDILPDGSPLLLDFGAARHEIINQAESSTVILKPGFAPIEQYGGKETAAQQGPWTDIYALSAVAYQLITGHMPPASVARIMRDPLTPLAAMQTAGLGLPATVLKAIDVGLQVQPQDRPQSIEAFRELLLATEDSAVIASDDERIHQQQLVDEAASVSSTAAVSHSEAAIASAAQAEVSMPSVQKRPKWALGVGALAGLVILLSAVFFFTRGSDDASTAAVVPAVDSQPVDRVAPSAPVVAVEPDAGAVALPGVVTPLPGGQAVVEQQAQAGSGGGSVPGLTESDAVSAASTVTTGVDGAAAGADVANDLAVAPSPDGIPSPMAAVEAGDAGATTLLPGEIVPEEESVPTTGFVVVQARPWGDVYLNGALVGTTPPSVRLEVPVGRNTIELRNDSAQPHVRTITVKGGETVRVGHEFAP